jgi:hypothetical protein
MPREPQPGAAPQQQQRSQPAGNPFAGGMPDLSSMFGGGRSAGAASPFAGANPFGGQARPGGGGAGGMGGIGDVMSKVMGNPQAMAVLQVHNLPNFRALAKRAAAFPRPCSHRESVRPHVARP